MNTFRPSRKYIDKMRLGISIVALLILVCGVLLSLLLSLDEEIEIGHAVIISVVTLVLDVVFWVPALFLAQAYYNSLRYEIQDDEVIVHAGILTKSVKHVPYRTVTNLTIKRDILDRWIFGLGTLNIQTAGMSGTTGAEESLVGLPNVQEVYEIVVTELRRFRGSMAPTAAEVESAPIVTSNDTLSALLVEVQAIRKTLEQRE